MNWSTDDARERYNIDQWGEGFFDINEHGDLVARPDPSRPEVTVRLAELVDAMRRRGMSLPVLLRFNNILRTRLNRLTDAFARAREQYEYDGQYRAVYPIKVNQLRHVVELLQSAGSPETFGLEAGSKPELMAVLGIAPSNALIVCNGYKDREYIRTALIAERLGHHVFLVIEKMSEVSLVLEEAASIGVRPRLGVRVRLASSGHGRWKDSGGEKSKFGLSPSQILRLLTTLKEHQAMDTLQLVHYHLGSQLANIRDIRTALSECARYYAELRRLGAPIDWVDVGGGLGVDYEGTSSRSSFSVNYSIQEYANKVTAAMAEICRENDLPRPNIISESGRAMTAHHAVLIADAIGTEVAPGEDSPSEPQDDAPHVLHELWRAYQSLSRRTALEAYHDAIYYLQEAQSRYTSGQMTLAETASAEELYFAICRAVRAYLQQNPGVHSTVLDELNEKLADKVFLNFSLFQSLPDSWAIDQIFPVLPIHGLNRQPGRRVILQDITCDSDGKIDRYVDGEGIEQTLPVAAPQDGERAMMAIFLVGAYQEILGDLHNLFGDTHSVHVETTENGYRLENPLWGDSVSDVLRLVDYEPASLHAMYSEKLAALDDLPDAQRMSFLEELSRGLQGYCYLE